jgi:hypothetical protein
MLRTADRKGTHVGGKGPGISASQLAEAIYDDRAFDRLPFLADALAPYPADLMESIAVENLVNSVRCDGPERLQPPAGSNSFFDSHEHPFRRRHPDSLGN